MYGVGDIKTLCPAFGPPTLTNTSYSRARYEATCPFPSLPYCPPTITSTVRPYSRIYKPMCVAALTTTSIGRHNSVSITTSAALSSPATRASVSFPQGSLKTGQSGSLQNRTTVKARDIDVDRSPCRLCRHEQCLERRKETASHRTGKARMVFTKDRARNRCSA